MEADPRLAALVCRENPGLCAEAYGARLAVSVAVWGAFPVETRFEEEVCRLLGWRVENGACVSPNIVDQVPLGYAYIEHVHFLAAKLEPPSPILRLYTAYPPLATLLPYGVYSYSQAWAALASTIFDVAVSAGGESYTKTTVYIHTGCCIRRIEVGDMRRQARLALPGRYGGWEREFRRLKRLADCNICSVVNPGGQVLEVFEGPATGPVVARDGKVEGTGVTAEEVLRRLREANEAAERILRAVGER